MAYLNPSNFNIISCIFGMGQGLRFNCLFKRRKFLRYCTWFVFAFGCEKYRYPHYESLACFRMPILTSLSNSFLNMASCVLGTGYLHEHTNFVSSFNSKFVGLVLHVPIVPFNISSDILKRDRIISQSSGSRYYNFSVVTLFGSAFL